ncbi:MAG: helix-turn-helix transcriptional regulator [Oscillospiraceae bacterium]|nr:helix-turn-helix transcriptional regulator [Oscillospiraceae bacterium]
MSKLYVTHVEYIQDYGKVKIKLKELLDARGKTRYFLAKESGTKFVVVDSWCKNTVSRIDLDVLARFCFVLDCRVDDIIEYTK